MKNKLKILLAVIAVLICAVGCTPDSPWTDSLYIDGDIGATGNLIGNTIYAHIEGYSIDVVQFSDMDIVLNDTIDVVFAFEPSIIVLDYSARCLHSVTYEPGHTTGHCILVRTAVDTVTCNTNCTVLNNNAGSVGSVGVQDNAFYALIAYGGYDGATDSYFFGEPTWDSADHTLTITFTIVTNTHTTFNFVEVVATAYR